MDQSSIKQAGHNTLKNYVESLVKPEAVVNVTRKRSDHQWAFGTVIVETTIEHLFFTALSGKV